MGRPTLVSLAKELGVSRQTVSNVINAPHLVKPETRERVQAAIEASGYRPNVAAQALRNQRSQTLAMRIYPSSDGIYGAVMDRFLHHLVQQCRAHGYNMMPLTARDDEDELAQLVALFDRGSIDGCILSGTSVHDVRPEGLQARGVPLATFGRPWQNPSATYFWVDVDGSQALHAGVQELLARGYGQVGFLGFRSGSGPGDDRRAGWIRGIEEHGGRNAPLLETSSDDKVEEGMCAAEELVAAGADALVCSSDSLAFGAIEYLRQKRPGDANYLPVIGFDDTPVARAVGFSSVSQPVEMAVSLLVHAMLIQLDPEQDSQVPPGMLLSGELMLRDGLASPATGSRPPTRAVRTPSP